MANSIYDQNLLVRVCALDECETAFSEEAFAGMRLEGVSQRKSSTGNTYIVCQIKSDSPIKIFKT